MSEWSARIKGWLSVVGSWAVLQPVVENLARLLAPRHRVGVFVVCVDREDRVLLLRHVLHPKAPWGLPGGWLNRNERPQDGACREFREETGLEVRLGPVTRLDIEKEPWHITIVFVGQASDGQIRLGREIADHGWFSEGELPAGTPPFVESAIRASLRFPGTTAA